MSDVVKGVISRKRYVAVDKDGKVLCGKGTNVRWLSECEINDRTYINMFYSMARAKSELAQKIGIKQFEDNTIMIVPVCETIDFGILGSFK